MTRMSRGRPFAHRFCRARNSDEVGKGVGLCLTTMEFEKEFNAWEGRLRQAIHDDRDDYYLLQNAESHHPCPLLM